MHHPEAADLLTQTEAQRLLSAFMGAPMTASEAASRLGMETNPLLYWIKKFLRLGLIQHMGERSRAGRPMKTYQATAAGYFVPFQATTQVSLASYLAAAEEQVNTELREHMVRVLEEAHQDWGLRLTPGPEGVLHARLAAGPDRDLERSPDAPPFLSFVYPYLQLDFPDAKQLEQEVLEVFQKYTQKTGGQRYVWRLSLLPVQE